ncbi:metallophosphoesterase [Candidatus Nanohalovita haloferacivicina]|uniref:metallophosphoesterase n=1 Tax=Candidatus Nanohalovita haloferacivicina TaxID=2978046 RepID=UPI00325FAF93|nr:YfcE family phosphodiesterase [Candidatus Nanohalobia archaeon BNXNv]
MIAVVSDSHVPTRAEKIPEEYREKMKEAELTVHAGDFAEKPVYNGIDEYGELVAVKGNCDFFDLPTSETFEKQGLKFGVYHGTGINPRGDHDTLSKIAEEDLEVDVLIHGHSHQEEIAKHEGKILLNPGSCTGVGGGTARPGNPTMMEIELSENELEARIIEKTEEGELKEKETRTFKL